MAWTVGPVTKAELNVISKSVIVSSVPSSPIVEVPPVIAIVPSVDTSVPPVKE